MQWRSSVPAFPSLRNCQNARFLTVLSLWSSYIIFSVSDAPVCIAKHGSHLNWQLCRLSRKSIQRIGHSVNCSYKKGSMRRICRLNVTHLWLKPQWKHFSSSDTHCSGLSGSITWIYSATVEHFSSLVRLLPLSLRLIVEVPSAFSRLDLGVDSDMLL